MSFWFDASEPSHSEQVRSEPILFTLHRTAPADLLCAFFTLQLWAPIASLTLFARVIEANQFHEIADEVVTVSANNSFGSREYKNLPGQRIRGANLVSAC